MHKLSCAQLKEDEKLLLAELGQQFPEIENKGYDNSSLKKKEKA